MPRPRYGHRVVRIEGQRLVVVGEREIELAGLAVDQAAVAVGLGVVRIEADRLVEIGERLVVAAGLAVHRAAHVVGLRIVRIALHHAAQRGDVGGRGGELIVLDLGGRRAGDGLAAGERCARASKRKRDDPARAALRRRHLAFDQSKVPPRPVATRLFTKGMRRTFDDSPGSKNAKARAGLERRPAPWTNDEKRARLAPETAAAAKSAAAAEAAASGRAATPARPPPARRGRRARRPVRQPGSSASSE